MNLVKEFLLLKAKVDKLYCQLIAKSPDEQDPTVPNHVKTIKQEDIDNWNNIKEEEVQITEDTAFAQIGQSQKDFNKSVSDYKTNSDLKNQEQDDRLTAIEGDNTAQYDLINDLNSELDSERARNDAQDSILNNLEGINYVWSPTNRTLTLFDRGGNQLSQVSLVSLDNEGTDIRYNASTLSLELYNADNELLDSIPVSSFIGSVGTQLQLNSNQLQLKDSQGNILSTVSFSIVNIQGLQTALDSRLNKGSYPGNASDLKTEIDGKLNKPTTTSNTTSYPYVVGEDGNGNPARLPAGDLGKNFFNSDLSNTTARNHTMNAGITINTLGNPYSITGLPNKASDTTNFDNVLRYNPITGQFAYGQAFVYNVPSTITVNHVNTPASPDVPSYIQAIQDRLTQLHQPEAVMQKFTNWNIITLNNLQDTNTNVKNNETINTYLQPFFNDSSISVGSDIISIHSSKVLPRNSDFAIRFSVKLGHNGVPMFNSTGNVTNRLIGLFTGTVGAFCSPELYVYDAGGDYGTNLLSLQSTGATVKTIFARAATDTSTIIYTGNQEAVINFIILKVGDNILVQANYGAKTLSEIYPASVIGSGDFGFCVRVQKPQASNSSTGVVSNIRYYIFP